MIFVESVVVVLKAQRSLQRSLSDLNVTCASPTWAYTTIGSTDLRAR